eukprot:scaffold12513_cov68-Isochrysis_galbana.AAC.2
MLHARSRTVGVMPLSVNVGGRGHVLVDVGGQRTDRRQWVHAFDHVTAVLFVASLSEMDVVR